MLNLIERFQDLVAQVPEILQPLIVALAGAVPFVEGEGAAVVGIVGGIHPAIAIVAGIAGNFICVAVVVMLSSGAREAVVTRQRQRSDVRVAAGGGPLDHAAETAPPATTRRAKFQRAFERYGVPGVSLLGPLLLPTQITASMLAAAGVGRARVLVWQGAAIIIWTTAVALLVTGVLSAAG